jgi:hypothetical protein
MNPSWLIFVNDTLDKIENGTISIEEGHLLIKRNKEVPEDVRTKYGWKKVGRPAKDG